MELSDERYKKIEEFILNEPLSDVYSLLGDESSFIVATIMSPLLEKNIKLLADFLSLTPVEKTADILRFISEIRESDKKNLKIVSEYLSQKLNRKDGNLYGETKKSEIIARILFHFREDVREQILDILGEKYNLDLDKIKGKIFTFNDIVLLSDNDVLKIMKNTDTTNLAKSLIDSPNEVREKIFRVITQKATRVVKQDMRFLKKKGIDKIDVYDARRKIVELIRELEEKGDIVSSSGGMEETLPSGD